MKFVSLLCPVRLESDPISFTEGELYYNTASSVYRVNSAGNWISIVDENNVHVLTSNNIIEYGDDTTQSFSLTLNESFENNTIYARSASTSYVIIDNSIDYPIRIGAEVHFIKGGDGALEFISASPNIVIASPSEIYLTKKWDTATLLKVQENLWLVQGEFRDLY